jgi:phosphoesterase RecJ-like protein
MKSIYTSQAAQSSELIDKAKRIVITSHKSPDGDAVGSSLGLQQFLLSLHKEVTVILPDGSDAYLHWMTGYTDIVLFEENPTGAEELIAQADLLFVLDYNNYSRTGEAMEKVLRKHERPVIMIDHHQQPEPISLVEYSDTSACSTSEMVYMFVQSISPNTKLSLGGMEALYCGIMTDSGSFRFPSVTPDTHLIVAEMMALGLDHARIHREVYDTNLLDRLRLVGFALSEKLEVWENCATAIISLSQEELKKYNHRPGDTEGLVNQALSIKDIKLAVFLREGNNEVKLSFRSKGNFDVNQFARGSWNGGGHKNAAGARTEETLSGAIARLKNELSAIADQIVHS